GASHSPIPPRHLRHENAAAQPPARRSLRAAPHAPPTLARRGHRAAASQRLQIASSLLRAPRGNRCAACAAPWPRRAPACAVAAPTQVAARFVSTITAIAASHVSFRPLYRAELAYRESYASLSQELPDRGVYLADSPLARGNRRWRSLVAAVRPAQQVTYSG